MSAAAPVLRDYQHAALASIGRELAAGRNRVLIKKPTGTGKTVMFAAMPDALKDWLHTFPSNERRMLVIAHREELLDQAAAKIHAANKHLVVMVEQADRVASPYADVVVASIQTLSASKFRRLDRLLSRMVFRIVVVDECHHAAATTYRGALARLGFLPTVGADDVTENTEAATWDEVTAMEGALAEWDEIALKDRVLVGVTATPNRSDAVGLNCVFQSIAYDYALRQAILDKWLVPITPYVVETAENLDNVKTVAGDFNQGQLATAVNTPARNLLAVTAWREYALNRPTLAFTVDVQHAKDLAEAFVKTGIRAAAISGVTPKDERRQTLADFTAGRLDVITNCMILTEGTDLPRTSCILHCKPTKSATLYEQMTGRGLRLFDGKADCIVLDVVDIARKHSLQTAPQLYGLPPGLLAKGDKTLDSLATEWDEFLAERPGAGEMLANQRLTLAQLRAKVSTFDLWTIPDLGDFKQAVSLNWVRNGDESYRLEYPWQDGKELLEVRRDMLGHWEIVITIRTPDGNDARGRQVWSVRQRTLANSIISRDEAAKTAEAFVKSERRSVSNLKDRNARWRQDPASPGQITQLQKHKVPFKPSITKGEASDILDQVFARKAAKRRA